MVQAVLRDSCISGDDWFVCACGWIVDSGSSSGVDFCVAVHAQFWANLEYIR